MSGVPDIPTTMPAIAPLASLPARLPVDVVRAAADRANESATSPIGRMDMVCGKGVESWDDLELSTVI